MKLNGEVTTGLGKAAFFLSQDFYVNNFLNNCGFKPYPGTLNVIVPDEYLNHINEVKNNAQDIIQKEEKNVDMSSLLSTTNKPENKFFVDLNVPLNMDSINPLDSQPPKVRNSVNEINKKIETW